jgi:hypothetical protein
MNPTVIVVIVIGFVVAIVAMFSSWAALLKTAAASARTADAAEKLLAILYIWKIIPRGTARGRR